MATKKEIEDLKSEILRLQCINENLNNQLSIEFKRSDELHIKNEAITQRNNFLQDELNRTIKARETYYIMNINLMHAIAAMGANLVNETTVYNNHLCNPNYNTFNLMEVTP